MSNNDNNVAMLDVAIDTFNTVMPTIDTTPTVYEFTILSVDDQTRIVRLINDIGQAWHIVSPASPFPYQYHPDPDTQNWGIALLSAICRLAKTTQGQISSRDQAVQHVCRSIEERNMGM